MINKVVHIGPRDAISSLGVLFILFRIVVDPESIECEAWGTNTFTHLCTQLWFWKVGGNQGTQMKPTQIWKEQAELKQDKQPSESKMLVSVSFILLTDYIDIC